MGPLDMVLAKDALCEALERQWGQPAAAAKTRRILSAGSHEELELAFKDLGMELMTAGRNEAGWEFAKIWKGFIQGGGAAPIPAPSSIDRLDDDDDVEAEGEDGAGRRSKGWSLGLGKGKAKIRAEGSTTDELASAATVDHLGPVTEWQEESESSKRIFAHGRVGLALAKAELAAIVRSKLGSKGSKIVDRVEASTVEDELALAVGEAQRKLVHAGMPRLAAKMAKKWLELRGRIE